VSTKTLIFIPTYNERENVTPMCTQILALGLDADLVFMDDGSPDGTGKVLDDLAAQHPRVAVIHRTKKSGIGSAHLEGIAYAYDKGYDRLLTMDCDFTHSPSLIPEFLDASKTAPVVVGSRYLGEESLPGWTIVRKILTRAGHLLTESMLGISQDATGAFRVYDLRTIPRALFELVQSRGYAFFFESLLIVNKNHFAIAEIAIKLPARTAGHSKMSFIEVRRSLTTLMTLLVATRTNPSRFLLKGDAARARA
jgi:dolichol-phosphate mannosyltransferase